MKIFVTVSKGYLGKHLTERLSKKHDIVGYNISDRQDIRDYNQLKAAMKSCDMAVYSNLKVGPNTFLDDYANTVCIGTHNITKAAIENDLKKLIYISSTDYYGAAVAPVLFPLKEDNRTVPMYLKADDLKREDYSMMCSQSKILVENILAFYGMRKKMPITILRFSRIGDLKGPDDAKTSIPNAIHAVEKAINLKKKLWYEAFNISDKSENVDISKAQKILGYRPI